MSEQAKSQEQQKVPQRISVRLKPESHAALKEILKKHPTARVSEVVNRTLVERGSRKEPLS